MKDLYVVLLMVLVTAGGWFAILSQTPIEVNNAHADKEKQVVLQCLIMTKFQRKEFREKSLVNFTIKGHIKEIKDGDTVILIGAKM